MGGSVCILYSNPKRISRPFDRWTNCRRITKACTYYRTTISDGYRALVQRYASSPMFSTTLHQFLHVCLRFRRRIQRSGRHSSTSYSLVGSSAAHSPVWGLPQLSTQVCGVVCGRNGLPYTCTMQSLCSCLFTCQIFPHGRSVSSMSKSSIRNLRSKM